MIWAPVLTYIPLIVSILITFAIASILAMITDTKVLGHPEISLKIIAKINKNFR